MDQIQKQWRKLSGKDRAQIRTAMHLLQARAFEKLDRKKLKGYQYIYRIRVGNYRLIYFDNEEEILLKYLKKRNEKTYKDL